VTTAEEEAELYAWAANALPDWYADDDRANEYLHACSRLFAQYKDLGTDWLARQTMILLADGPTPTSPDFLDAHARERGTFRQAGESDDVLRARLHAWPDPGVTRPGLIDAITALLTAAGASTSFAMDELPRDGAYTGSHPTDTGTGGVFAVVAGGNMTFTPLHLPWPSTPYTPIYAAPARALETTGAADPANDVAAAPVIGVIGDGVEYAGAGTAGGDGGVTWKLHRLDSMGNVLDGVPRSYASRGYRCNSTLPLIIVMLPYGTSDIVYDQVVELVRRRKAGGIRYVVERREVP